MKAKHPAPTAPRPAAVELDTAAVDMANAAAPFVFVDIVSASGCTGGIAWITLEAFRHRFRGDQPVVDSVITANLRLSVSAARQLREALQAIELMATKPDGPAN